MLSNVKVFFGFVIGLLACCSAAGLIGSADVAVVTVGVSCSLNCGSRASRRIATLSLGIFRLGLGFARENVALRISFGNQRASDFGLRPKATKGRIRCAYRQLSLMLGLIACRASSYRLGCGRKGGLFVGAGRPGE